MVLLLTAACFAACGDDNIGGDLVDAAADVTVLDGDADGSSFPDAGPADGGPADGGPADGRLTVDAADSAVVDTGTADASADVTLALDSGGGIIDAAPGGDGAVLNCGNAQCNLPNETCCIYPLLSPPPPFYGACSNGNSCPALTPDAGVGEAGAATELQCEVQANCPPNNVCCIQGPSSGTAGKISAHCLNANACTTQTTQILLDAGADATPTDGGVLVQPRAVLCDPAATDAGCPTAAGACSTVNIATWNVPNAFATCGGKAR